MLFGFNLNHLFIFPFQDQNARKHFLIGCLVYLAGFVIPILPGLLVMGYSAILIRQVLNGEKPHLVPWENWEALLKDGARLFGIRLVYSMPLFILMVPLFLIFLAFPILPLIAQNSDNEVTGVATLVFVLAVTGISLLILPLSLAIGLIAPAAEVHVIEKDEFMAGLRPREWWPIFKRNWGGFVVALAITYAIMMVMSFGMQIMIMTIVLMCLLPLFLPVIYMYYTVIQYVTFTQAYKDGRDKLGADVSVSSV